MTKGTIAITGATGMVGSCLVRRAVAAGWQIRALTRRASPPQEGVTWISGALDQPDGLIELARGADAVIHVAGVVNAPDAAGFEAGNVMGTRNMIAAAKAAGVRRFIHVSSLAAREPMLSNYGGSKARAETEVAHSGLDWTMVRPPGVYGPDDRDMLDLFRMAQWGWVLTPPKGSVSLIEVNDLARLLLVLAEDSRSTGKTYEADDGVEGGWTHVRLANAIGWAVNKRATPVAAPALLIRIAARLDRLFRRGGAKLTPDRARYLCHPDWVITPSMRPPESLWMPQVETRAGLKQTAIAYRRKGWI